MNKSILAAVLAAASLPALAAEPGHPADPDVHVPAPAYRSVFEGEPRGLEEQTVDWRKANAAVAEFPRGHIDLLKWEERNLPGAATVPAPAAPAAAPARPQGQRHH